MAIVTYPLNNINYNAEDAQLYNCTRTNGIFAGDDFSIEIIDGRNIKIGKGIAWISYKRFTGIVIGNKSDINLDLDLPDSSLDRIDTVVLRYNAIKNESEIIIKKGIPAITPEITPPERSIENGGDVYELILYSIYRKKGQLNIEKSDISDVKLDEFYCGLMRDGVTRIPTQTLHDSFYNWQEKEKSEFKDFVNNIKTTLDENTAGNLYNKIEKKPDQEVGVWTPNLIYLTNEFAPPSDLSNFIGYKYRSGKYIRTGKELYINFYLEVLLKKIEGGWLEISGFPFPLIDNENYNVVIERFHLGGVFPAVKNPSIIIGEISRQRVRLNQLFFSNGGITMVDVSNILYESINQNYPLIIKGFVRGVL